MLGDCRESFDPRVDPRVVLTPFMILDPALRYPWIVLCIAQMRFRYSKNSQKGLWTVRGVWWQCSR